MGKILLLLSVTFTLVVFCTPFVKGRLGGDGCVDWNNGMPSLSCNCQRLCQSEGGDREECHRELCADNCYYNCRNYPTDIWKGPKACRQECLPAQSSEEFEIRWRCVVNCEAQGHNPRYCGEKCADDYDKDEDDVGFHRRVQRRISKFRL